MKTLITGLNNYLGKKLAYHLADEGYETFCLVRNEAHFLNNIKPHPNIHIIEGDLVRERYPVLLNDMDVSIYLSQDAAEWDEQYKNLELLSLTNFVKQARRTNSQQLIYITRLRTPFIQEIRQILSDSYISFTIVRISNIIGNGSILMEMMQKISSKLIIFANKRLFGMRTQPIALHDLLMYLGFITLNPVAFNQCFDIGGPQILSYKDMLKNYLILKHLRRLIVTLPDFGNRLSAIITSLSTGISVNRAKAYGQYITSDLLCENNHIHDLFPYECMPFEKALEEALIAE